MIPRKYLSIALCGALAACTPSSPPPAADSAPQVHGQQMIAWAGDYEFFIDFPILPAGEPVALAIHITASDGSPAPDAPLQVVLRNGEQNVELAVPGTTYSGIWLPEATLPTEGEWQISLRYEGTQCTVGSLVATSDRALAAEVEAAGPSPDAIVVLKQQQWPARIRTEAVGMRELEERLPVVVHATPVPSASARLRAPAFGRLELAENTDWPKLGEAVEVGQLLGIVRMPLLPGDPATQRSTRLEAADQARALEIGLLEAQTAMASAEIHAENAATQLTRVGELHDKGARSDRELELAIEADVLAEQALEAASRSLEAWVKAVARGRSEGVTAELTFELRAPCSGLVIEAAYAPGAWVDSADELMHIVDPGRLRYGVRMHVDDLARLESPRTFVRLPDGGTMELPGEDGELLLARPPVDPGSHVGELVYEAPAPSGLLPGAVMQAQVSLAEPREVLAVPTSALVEEDGLTVVFVQLGGEAFERRVVRLGLQGLDAVEVLEGVSEGERIVADGAYTIRLASLSGSIPAHTH